MTDRTERITFAIGSRRLLTVELKLARLSFELEEILDQRFLGFPDLAGTDGLKIRSLPIERHDQALAAYPGLVPGMIHRYQRSYIAMEGGLENYLAKFSPKTRSTMRRKARRLADAGGGTLDIREYRGAEGLEEFLRLALPLSARTYQGRMLKGLRDDPASQRTMRALAAEDRMRSFILFLEGEPAAYLYMPVIGQTLFYAHLGYDSRFASLSPGTVLLWTALERLFAEKHFRYFDFTEGESSHKLLFGSDSVACETLLLLKPSLSNRTLLLAHSGFEAALRGGKAVLRKIGAEARLRRVLRS